MEGAFLEGEPGQSLVSLGKAKASGSRGTGTEVLKGVFGAQQAWAPLSRAPSGCADFGHCRELLFPQDSSAATGIEVQESVDSKLSLPVHTHKRTCLWTLKLSFPVYIHERTCPWTLKLSLPVYTHARVRGL